VEGPVAQPEPVCPQAPQPSEPRWQPLAATWQLENSQEAAGSQRRPLPSAHPWPETLLNLTLPLARRLRSLLPARW